jgi:hypothetical protein
VKKFVFLLLLTAGCGGANTVSGPAQTPTQVPPTPAPTMVPTRTPTPRLANIFGVVTGINVVGTHIPLSGIDVSVNGRASIIWPTDGSGRYQVNGLSAGLATLSAIDPRGQFASYQTTINLPSGTTRFDFDMGPLLTR